MASTVSLKTANVPRLPVRVTSTSPTSARYFLNSPSSRWSLGAVAAFGAGQLCLGGHKPPLDRRLEYRGPIPLQVPLHPLQRRHGVVEPSEVAFDGLDDPMLLGERGHGEGQFSQEGEVTGVSLA